MDAEPKFIYKQLVRVKRGFFRGMSVRVCDYESYLGYKFRIQTGEPFWIKEDDLEAI